MKILVVSGFLGAGKTTFIQELARRSGRDFIVYENEYGQADIDAKVLAETDELSVWESTENCICCSGKQDFAASILTISNTLDPEYLVVEPTGVARLSSVMDNIDQVSYERIVKLEPLVIVDSVAWQHQRKRFEEIYADQIKSAPVIVLSKLEHAGEGEQDELISWLRGINPDAFIVDKPYGQMPDEWFRELLEQYNRSASTPVVPGQENPDQAHDPAAAEIETISLAGAQLESEGQLVAFLDALCAGVYGEVIRAKGYLPCGSQWLRFDVVDRAWSVIGTEPEPGGAADARVVFIGPGLRRSWLRQSMLPLIREAAQAGDLKASENSDLDYGHHHHDHYEHDHHHHDHHDHDHRHHDHHDHDHDHHDYDHHHHDHDHDHA